MTQIRMIRHSRFVLFVIPGFVIRAFNHNLPAASPLEKLVRLRPSTWEHGLSMKSHRPTEILFGEGFLARKLIDQLFRVGVEGFFGRYFHHTAHLRF